jgi:hypothetical protein
MVLLNLGMKPRFCPHPQPLSQDLPCIHKLVELLDSPFTPPQPSPFQGEGAKPPLSKGGLGG